jgi:hypothetical protein
LWRPHRLTREILAAFLGSAVLGELHLADWTFNAAQAFLGLAAVIYLGYFLAACVSESAICAE